ncbi:rhodanese-like domain-containing protein [Anaeromyxobacter sp. Fw109-5]|uniref:rhodanese-like domain-containing protein n=1 Tax=Anaeromyxobacter sp. (strain Fw109-5) TaxID=404589 RepID=UPI0000ED8A28|nr:rhodanese-like domain-containing protein [Anaeromyxobacter sp. Fw109-5]ABS27189.1 rhodanese-like domain protein [Anaeromyxobacter sp. Fw109-5]
MGHSRLVAAAVVAAALLPGAALAEVRTVGAEEVQALSLASSRHKVLIVDSRSAEEFAQAHLPGAISIPAGWMMAHQGSLPKDRAAPIVFYCRGAG